MSGYIGTLPTPQATQTRDVFTATASQTTFATSGYTVGFLDVYVNGVHLQNGTDYTATNGSDVVMSSGLTAGDYVEVVAFTTFSTSDTVSASGGGTFSGNINVTGTVTSDGLTVDSDGTLLDFSRVGDAVTGKLKYVDADTGFHFGTTTNHDIYLISNDTKRVKIDNGGVVSVDNLFGLSDTDTGIALGANGADIMQFYTGNNERARLDASGNLMVGTTSNQFSLTSGGDAGMVYRANASLDVARDDGTVMFINRLTSDGDFVEYRKNGSEIGTIQNNGNNFIFKGKHSSGVVQLQTHDGNEDIELDPSGFIKFETAGAEKLRIDSGGALNGPPSANFDIKTGSGTGDMRFFTNGTQKFHIEPSGRQSHLADVSGNLAKFENQHSSTPDVLWLRMSNTAPDNNSQYFVYCSDSSTLRCAIWSDGDIDNHDNSYGGTSDQKLKQQITDASSQWDDIKALQVRKFKFNDDVEAGDSDEHWRLGVIAQEVESAGMSGLVNDRVDKDEDGNTLETTTKSVKYSVLYMKAVKALQEAMTRIETLETENAAIKARLDALEAE